MSARPPLRRCRRALARQSPTSPGGVWITDWILYQAIERYCHATGTQCRCLSTKPGPLESRRRSGKRHMTAINACSPQPLRPPFSLEVLQDIGKWHWEPPTDSASRRAKTKPITVSRAWNGLLEWLEQPDPEKPFIEPPKHDDRQVFQDTLSNSPSTTTETTAQHEGTPSIAPENTPSSVQSLREEIQSISSLSTRHLSVLCSKHRAEMESRISDGSLTSSHIIAALDPFDAVTRGHMSRQMIQDEWLQQLRFEEAEWRLSIVRALASLSKPALDQHDGQLWASLLNQTCAMVSHPEHTTMWGFRLFRRLLNLMPSQHLSLITQDHLFFMTRSALEFRARNIHRLKQWPICTLGVMLGNALQKLSAARWRGLCNDMETFVQGQDDVIRLFWLEMVAYHDTTSTSQFIKAYTQAMDTLTLTSEDLWLLLRARVLRDKALLRSHSHALLEESFRGGLDRWTSLILAIMSGSGSNEGLKELCSTLTSLDQSAVLVESMTSGDKMSFKALRTLTISCDDHHLALALHQAATRNLALRDEKIPKKAAWDWTAWGVYAERIIKDPTLPPDSVWTVLALHNSRHGRASTHPIAGPYQTKAHLLEKMAEWYLEADHLTQRQQLRFVERCLHEHRACSSGRLSIKSLAHLATLLTRDLEKGQIGRSARLTWLVGLIEKHDGVETARKVLKQLRGWRWTIVNRPRKRNHVQNQS